MLATAAIAQKKEQAPAAWGQYKKLAQLSPDPSPGMENFDTLRFVLAKGETRVEHIERKTSGPNASAKNQHPNQNAIPLHANRVN